jgi:hypothetical protein
MSAEIIQFVPRPRGRRADETADVLYSPWRQGDLTMDQADTAPCEYTPPPEARCDEDTPA